tara:strand:- start:480 stop:1307 length:828 start_codon:yes stop_codon:yes gene_type:complete
MLTNYLKLLSKKLIERNFKWLLFEIISRVTFKKLELRVDKIVENKRKNLADKLSKIYSNIVQQGPFKGMVINNDQFWGQGDKSSKILGIYEKETQELMVEIQEKNNYTTFIDIGGADGYFAIGSLINGLFDECHVFEVNKKGRDSIQRNALKNGLKESIKIHGKATKKELLKIKNLKNSLILCDIEGGEYKLFEENLIKEIFPSTLIIEIHYNNKLPLEQFEEYFKGSYSLNKIFQNPRSLNEFKELKKFNDNNRALIVSEGRSCVQEWWYLSPK